MTGTLGSGWRTLVRSPDRVLVPTLVLAAGGVVVHVLLQYLLGAGVAGAADCTRPYLDQVLTARCGPTNGRAQLTLVLGLLALLLVGQLVGAGLYRACLDAVDDAPVRGPFAGWLTPPVVLGGLLVASLLTLGTVFLVLPAVVLGFLARYAPLFALDQGLGPGRALTASARLVIADLLGETLFVLRAVVVLLLGAALLGFGLVLAVPVVLLAQTERYRRQVQTALVEVRPR